MAEVKVKVDSGVVNTRKSKQYSQESEAWAVGKKDGVDVPNTADQYHNNSKYYKEIAMSAATTATNMEYNAEQDALKSEAYAVGKRNGVDVTSGDPAYHNNSKYYAIEAWGYSGDAENAKIDAVSAKNAAASSKLDSEAYAVGKRNGSDVTSGDPAYHNNAKYYKDQSASYASDAHSDANYASGYANQASASATTASGHANAASGSAGNAAAAAAAAASSATAAAASASAIAATYDNTKTYAVGEYCLYNGGMYVCTTAITVAEAWTAAHWSAVKVGTELTALKEDIKDNYAKNDGYYDTLTAGSAEQLVATTFEEDNKPYLFRTSGGSIDIGDREFDALVGGTVAWNQLAPEADFSTHNHWWKGNGCDSVTFSNGIATVVTLQDPAPATIYNRLIDCDGIGYVKDHAYLACYEYKLNAQIPSGIVPRATIQTYMPMFTTPGKDVTSNNWETFARVFKAIESSGTSSVLTRFRIDMGASYTDSYEYQLRRPQVYDLTAMFGSTIADYIYTLEQGTAGAGVAWFRKLFPKPYYAYNAGELMSVQAASHDMVGFNAFDGEVDLGGCWTETGTYTVIGGGYMGAPNKIKCLPNTTYCFTASNITAQGFLYYAAFDANGNYISSQYGTPIPADTKYGTFTTPSDCYFIGWYLWRSTAFTNAEAEDICVNLSWDGERDGEYEPYVKHSYPLDSDLVLRGVPKLDSSNNLYYDGDTYESDGTVTRKYGIVDLGTLTWNRESEGVFYATATSLGMNAITNTGLKSSLVCSNYIAASVNSIQQNKTGVGAYHYSGNNNDYIYIGNSAFDTAANAKTGLNGVYLVYELATPTTEEADAFTNPQIVDDFGTEEYVTTGIVPVGHITKYQANLRAKLEMAPNSPDGDGDYIVRQTSGVNEYVELIIPTELPTLPTEDGTYTLKCQVVGGTPTKVWVADE